MMKVSATMERVIAPITTAADDKFYEIFYFMEMWIVCEQMIHMKYQVLFVFLKHGQGM